MKETNKEMLDYFDSITNFHELKFDESYKKKLFKYISNMLTGNRLIYDIDVSWVQPVPLMSCLKEDKND